MVIWGAWKAGIKTSRWPANSPLSACSSAFGPLSACVVAMGPLRAIGGEPVCHPLERPFLAAVEVPLRRARCRVTVTAGMPRPDNGPVSPRRQPTHSRRKPPSSRRPRSTGATRTRGATRDPAAELTRIASGMAASVRRETAGLASGDALGAELVASALLSKWAPDWPDEREALNAMGAMVLGELAKAPDADTFALLLAVAAMATSPLDGVAQEAVASLRRRAVPEPIWSRTVGRPRLVDAWISTDELEDQSNVAAVFAFERERPHAIVAMTDANFHGLIRKAFVTAEPDRFRQTWAETSGMPIRPLEEQELADVLGQGLEMFDTYLDPPVDDEAAALMPLVRARLRLLPAPRSIEPPEIPEEERDALAKTFVRSTEAAAIRRASGRLLVEELAHWFIDFASDYGAGDPLRWSPIAVEILLIDWLPRKAILEPDVIAALPDGLRAFVRFAAKRKGLPEEVFGETIEAIDRFAPEFAAAMDDEGRAGPAKEIALGLRADGVDLTDAAAVQAWIDKRNRELLAD